MLDVQAHADESSRYSNTLLVSLNNRIYFRDHPFRGAHGNSQCYMDSGPTIRSTVTPLSFAQNGLPTTSVGESLKLGTVVSGTASVDMEKGTVGDSPNQRFVLLSSTSAKQFYAFELDSFMNEEALFLIPMHLKSLLLKDCCFWGLITEHLSVIVMWL